MLPLMEKASFARINWKSLGNVKASKPSHWTWNNAAKRSSGVKFIPNPCTTAKIVRVKLSKGRKAKLFRAPVVSTRIVKKNLNTTEIADSASCTVHAFANAAQVPFFAAYLALQQAGRKPCRGFSLQHKGKYGYVGNVAGYKVNKVTRGKTTLSEFLAKHPIGRFYVEGVTHAFAVIHGKVVDTLRGSMARSRKIEAAFTVTENNRE